MDGELRYQGCVRGKKVNLGVGMGESVCVWGGGGYRSTWIYSSTHQRGCANREGTGMGVIRHL